jgi:hypothetical protein
MALLHVGAHLWNMVHRLQRCPFNDSSWGHAALRHRPLPRMLPRRKPPRKGQMLCRRQLRMQCVIPEQDFERLKTAVTPSKTGEVVKVQVKTRCVLTFLAPDALGLGRLLSFPLVVAEPPLEALSVRAPSRLHTFLGAASLLAPSCETSAPRSEAWSPSAIDLIHPSRSFKAY